MHEVPVRLGNELFDALLPRREYELLKLPMGDQQCLRGRRLERDPAFRADDGVAQMDGAANAE